MRADAIQVRSESRSLSAQRVGASVPFSLIGALLCIIGFGMYFAGLLFAVIRLMLVAKEPLRALNEAIVWYSGLPVTIGLALLCAGPCPHVPGKKAALAAQGPRTNWRPQSCAQCLPRTTTI